MQNYLIHAAIGLIGASAIIGLAMKFGMKWYVGWLKKQPKYIQDVAVAGGLFAEKAVRAAEASGKLNGWSGKQKLDQAVELYTKMMTDAGLDPPSYDAAATTITAKHSELSDDKMTAFNDKGFARLKVLFLTGFVLVALMLSGCFHLFEFPGI